LNGEFQFLSKNTVSACKLVTCACVYNFNRLTEHGDAVCGQLTRA